MLVQATQRASAVQGFGGRGEDGVGCPAFREDAQIARVEEEPGDHVEPQTEQQAA